MVKKQSVNDRFWSKVQKTDGCWLWAASRSPRGYGAFQYLGRKLRAHRFAFEMANGPIPDGLFVCHRCDTPACVRPEHLFLGTHDENTADKVAKNRQLQGETHPRHKLSSNDVAIIRYRHSTGRYTYEALAREYGVSATTIASIVIRKTWH